MTTMTTVEAREKFLDLINQVSHSKERVIITRRGNNIASHYSYRRFSLIRSIAR